MPYIEQLLYGPNHLAETRERQELARSAGMGAEVAAEIGAVCDAWGQMPELGLTRRALIAQSLQATMPSMRGKLHTIISVGPGAVPVFHAVVVTDAIYSNYGRNPYCLARELEFCGEWNGKQGMDRVEIDSDPRGEFIDPAPNADDVGLIDEAVLEFILRGNLQLPLEQSVRDSDRALALIIACLPDKDRKDLKFASFTTAKVNAYDLAGVATEGAAFAGWQRLMMARIDTGITEQQQEYKSLIARYLQHGDLAGINRVSSRHEFHVTTHARPLVATRQGEEPTPVRRAPVAAPSSVARPAAFGPAATISAKGPGLASSGPRRPGAKTPSRGASLPEHGLDPSSGAISAGSRAGTSWRKRVRRGPVTPRGGRGSGGRILRTISVLLLVFAAGWVGTMWLEGRTLAESLEWAGLPGMDGGTETVARAGTLLEVVDVGNVYERALRHTGNRGLGLNAAGDKGREKALGRLQSGATTPLVEQVTLFVKLCKEGIQQSDRPDREVERLESLSGQGDVLANEMNRLELAWYSLTTGVNWADLGKLSDADVAARLDSLATVERGALADIRQGLGAVALSKDFKRSRREVEGMAALVKLFQAGHWSRDWEQQLAAAAEKVSPSAGKTTRAYRNSAYAILRLKRAERKPANRDLPFEPGFAAAQWPSTEVRSILPVLRREAGRFSDQSAPRLLGATLALYATLEEPHGTVDHLLSSLRTWRELQSNAAVEFDPALYGDFLGRLRYEAVARSVAGTGAPADIPSDLCEAGTGQSVAAFSDSLATLTRSEQWEAMAVAVADPFLRRWAGHLAADLADRLAVRQQEFAAAWTECRSLAIGMQVAARAGTDWSADWRRLHLMAGEARAEYATDLANDTTQQPRLAYLDTLLQALAEPGPLRMSRVTVRLDQSRLTEADEVQLELRTPARGGIWTSQPFQVGPAAPAGTGWVGTVFLDWVVPLTAEQELSARLVSAADQSELLLVSYPSLAAGLGPAALTRPHGNGQGSVAFQVALPEYWRSLKIPDLGQIF